MGVYISSMKMHLSYAALAVALLATSAFAEDAAVKPAVALDYKIYIGGLEALSATATIGADAAHYDIEIKAVTAGAVGRMMPWTVNIGSKGNVSGETLQPLEHAQTNNFQGKDRSVVLRYDGHGGFIDRKAERRMADEGVARFSVRTSSIEQTAGRLSGGNQQKIVLGKWLANKPKLLILDEPTRGIDVGAKAEIHRLMGELAGQGLAILMISSELPEVLGMSDRVLVMREGRIAAEFNREAATPQAVGAVMMGGGAPEAEQAA